MEQLGQRVLAALVVVITLSFNLGTSFADERERKALIVGNANYTGIPELKNSINDAVLMERVLSDRGFETTLLKNATKRQMKEAIQKFAKTLDQDSVGLFYFAGHGLEVNGRNYLVPVDASISSEADVEYETVDAGRLLSIFEIANNGLNLMILDACRDNPFSTGSGWRNIERSGLAPMRPATGSLVMYATEPGKVASDNPHGENGLFTKNLVDTMKQPGLKIEEVFKKTAIKVRQESSKKQTPYIEGVILGDFVFTEGDRQPRSPKTTNPHNTNDRTRVDREDTQFPFTVATRPRDARVRILNINPKYRRGMLLPSGEYVVEVSASGFRTQIRKVRHSGDSTVAWFELSEVVTNAAKSGKSNSRPTVIIKSEGAVDRTERTSLPSDEVSELEMWNRAISTNNVAGYKKYLASFPRGTFRMIAMMKLEKLGN
jgi:hypothetical protein